jgi:methionyl aminopeptidase
VIELKTPEQVDKLHAAGQVVARALAAVRAAAAVGVTLRELDEIADRVIRDAGATPAFRGYHPHFAPTPFPGTICASVNEVIVHGIPDDTPLQDGDLLSIDCGAHLDGWTGDAAFSAVIGTADPRDEALIEVTREALWAGIEQARPGNRIGDIAAAIGEVARGHGYGMPPDWGGHGIGRAMHEDPSVPNEGRRGRGLKLKAGLVICIEPMLHHGGDAYVLADDGWSVCTADGSRAAHEEHAVAITADGPVVLTAQD